MVYQFKQNLHDNGFTGQVHGRGLGDVKGNQLLEKVTDFQKPGKVFVGKGFSAAHQMGKDTLLHIGFQKCPGNVHTDFRISKSAAGFMYLVGIRNNKFPCYQGVFLPLMVISAVPFRI